MTRSAKISTSGAAAAGARRALDATFAAEAPSGTAREAILEAAVQEFVEHGYDGVRMEHVARRAGCNKALVYRYFGDRRNLFEQALQAQFAKRSALLERVPTDLGDMLAWWTSVTRKDPTFIRMILRESLDYRGDDPVESTSRAAYYERQKEGLDALRTRGVLDDGFDSEMLFLALLAVISLPSTMPQVVRLVTGKDAGSRAFTRRWEDFLHRLAGALAPRQPDRKPR